MGNDTRITKFGVKGFGAMEIEEADGVLVRISLGGVGLGGKARDSEVVDQLREYFAGTRRKFELEYELGGSEFEKKVWREMAKIGYGETVSYKELAERVGNPRGYRAVANACGKNPIPIVIPCHRVVGSPSTELRENSSVKNLGGYSAGIEKKVWLLRLEGVDVGGVANGLGNL